MDQHRKHLLVPGVIILVAIVLWTVIALLSVVDGEEIGSLAEWAAAFVGLFVGLVAAGFAALAWTEAKRATEAAERATRAEERAADVSERALRKDVKLSANYSDKIPGLTAIRIELAEGSPSIWIKDTGAHFIWHGDCTKDDLDQLQLGGATIHGAELPPGESIEFAWLHSSATNPLLDHVEAPGRIPRIGLLLDFTVTPRDHAQVFTQPLTLPETPRIH